MSRIKSCFTLQVKATSVAQHPLAQVLYAAGHDRSVAAAAIPLIPPIEGILVAVVE